LPDGRIFRGPRRVAIHDKCCTDYSDQRGAGYQGPIDDKKDDDDDDDEDREISSGAKEAARSAAFTASTSW
jgi:hypothetical protein